MNQDHAHLLDLLEYPYEELDKDISQSERSKGVHDITGVSYTAIQKLVCVCMYVYEEIPYLAETFCWKKILPNPATLA